MTRLTPTSFRHMFQIMRNNLGSIVLGVTFVAGLAWLLLGCGGGPENPGWGTQTDPIAASAVDDAGAGAVWAVSPCSLLRRTRIALVPRPCGDRQTLPSWSRTGARPGSRRGQRARSLAALAAMVGPDSGAVSRSKVQHGLGCARHRIERSARCGRHKIECVRSGAEPTEINVLTHEHEPVRSGAVACKVRAKSAVQLI